MTRDEAAADGTLAGRVATLEAGLRTLQANYEAMAARIAGMNLAPGPAPGPAPDETPDQIRDRMLARAKGCFDYSGGYRGDPKLLEAFHHGIQTVINALSDAGSMQTRVLESIGASPTRTEEEARREPRRGDRWRNPGGTYTLTRPWNCDQWYAIEDGEEVKGLLPGGVGHETYLGNFAHEIGEFDTHLPVRRGA